MELKNEFRNRLTVKWWNRETAESHRKIKRHESESLDLGKKNKKFRRGELSELLKVSDTETPR